MGKQTRNQRRLQEKQATKQNHHNEKMMDLISGITSNMIPQKVDQGLSWIKIPDAGQASAGIQTQDAGQASAGIQTQDSGQASAGIETQDAGQKSSEIKTRDAGQASNPIRGAEIQVSPSLLLTVKDLCDLLGFSRSKIVRMEKAGTLPGRLVLGGSVRYHRQIIETWLLSLCGKLSD